MNKGKYLVKGSISDADYDKLLEEKALDVKGRKLKVGDEIAFAVVMKYAYGAPRIDIIKDIWLEYAESWDYNSRKTIVDYQTINCKLKVGAVIRISNHVARLG
jgi:hypothetical protein